MSQFDPRNVNGQPTGSEAGRSHRDAAESLQGAVEPAEPYIGADQTLKEITVKAIVLGVILSVLLAGANAYLGLLAGMTVSASIPAAVISMAVLRMFRSSNILENNIVQTAASAGESLAAGVIFTFPALIILGTWTEFNYWQTTIIAGLGGLIGVLFTIPLRRALIVDSPLTYPEGVATAEVLKVGDEGGGGVKSIFAGGIVGALFKFGEGGLGLWTQSVEVGRQIGGSIAYAGTNLLPALVAVGYIVGINIAVLVFLGGALNWYGAIPIYAATNEWPVYELVDEAENPDAWDTFTVELVEPAADATAEEVAAVEEENEEIRAQIGGPVDAVEWANRIWSSRTRYIGVGAMVIGGLWALIRLWGSLLSGISSSFAAYRELRENGDAHVPRTERDTPMQWVLIALLFSVVPVFFVFNMVTGNIGISIVMAIVMLVAGFLFAAVASYMAGLVGSSNNPISGVTIATLLFASLLLFFLTRGDVALAAAGPGAAILIGAVVCCACAIGGDNSQDLKAGHILGATPYKQQIMQGVGVLAAAFVVAPILTLLLNAYGIVTPPEANPDATPLTAPQATLMASVAEGVFTQDLPWTMVVMGAIIAVAIIIIDLVLEARDSSFRMPVLAVAVGIYLPLELSVPILFGGLISLAVHRFHLRRTVGHATGDEREDLLMVKAEGERRGLLFAAGLITGEAMLGILLAIPIVMFKGENPMELHIAGFPAAWPGLVLLAVVIGMLYYMATRATD